VPSFKYRLNRIKQLEIMLITIPNIPPKAEPILPPNVLSKFDFRTRFPLKQLPQETLSKIYVFTSIRNMFFCIFLYFSWKREPFGSYNCFGRVLYYFVWFKVCLHLYLEHFKVFRFGSLILSLLVSLFLSLCWNRNDILVIFPYLFLLSWAQQQQQKQ